MSKRITTNTFMTEQMALRAHEGLALSLQIDALKDEIALIRAARLFRLASALTDFARTPWTVFRLPGAIIQSLQKRQIQGRRIVTDQVGTGVSSSSRIPPDPPDALLCGLNSLLLRPGPRFETLRPRAKIVPVEADEAFDPKLTQWRPVPEMGLGLLITTDVKLRSNVHHMFLQLDLRTAETYEETRPSLINSTCRAGIRFFQEQREMTPIQHYAQDDSAGHYVDLTLSENGVSFDLIVPIGTDQVELDISPRTGEIIEIRGPIRVEAFRPGISVIIPTYRGRTRILRCLESLAAQTLSAEQFEIIIVPNGEPDGSLEVIAAFQAAHPEHTVVVIGGSGKGASAARNAGIAHASRAYTCLLDDDDTLKPGTLERMLEGAAPHVMVLTPMVDIRDGVEVNDSFINRQILAQSEMPLGDIAYRDVSSALSTNAGKCVPTAWMAALAFDIDLHSGEDVVFWAELLIRYRPDITVVTETHDGQPVAYCRNLREDSLSRRKETFEFMVEERLDVIAGLDRILQTQPLSVQAFLQTKIIAQAMFTVRYLQAHPDRRMDVMAAIEARNIAYGLKSFVNSRVSTALYISYCFPPFVDPAAVVVAKRISERAAPTDVVSNAMYTTRQIDMQLLKLAEDHVGEMTLLGMPESFGDWRAMETFADAVIAHVNQRERRLGAYETMLSRVLWPASHFAAAALKVSRPKLFWSAEFSDPVRKDIHGADRPGEIDVAWLQRTGVLAAIRRQGLHFPKTRSVFAWCEYLPYLLADELVFTNPLQRDYMLSYIEDPTIRALAETKSILRPQPTFDEAYYDLAPSAYALDEDVINIGYFGAFYATRGFGTLLAELKMLPSDLRRRIVLHIFTEQLNEITELPDYDFLKDRLRLNAYVPYLEFLNLSKRFDFLLVTDVQTAGLKSVNPYLPSKLSDYAGSGRRIWCIYEAGSMMDHLSRGSDMLRTELTDGLAIRHALKELAQSSVAFPS